MPYIIITNNTTVSGEPAGDLVGQFQKFADWKMRKGTPAKVVTVDTIKATYPGGDTQEKIRHFIQDAYLKWNTRYVLLGGSGKIVPTRKIHIHTSGEKYTDLYYAAIFPFDDNWNADGNATYGDGGSDFTPDIDVGRAPVNSAGEAEKFRSKNLTYARTVLAPNGFPSNGDYLGRVLGVYGIAFLYPEHNFSYSLHNTTSPFNAGFYNIRDHRQDTDSIYGMFEYFEDWDQDSINGGDNPNYQPSWGLAYWPLHANEGASTEDYNENEVPIDNADITHQAVLDQINNGYGIINIIDHGGPHAIGIATQTQSNFLRADDFENLLSTNKYGLMIAGDCFTAPVGRKTYIGERWVNTPNGGVAFLGNADDIFASTSINFNKNFFDHLYNENTTDYHLSALRYQTIFEKGSSTRLYKQYQLLGDPELSLYTHAPTSPVTVTGYPNNITTGHHDNFNLQVSGLSGNQKALISVYKKEEVAASGYISTDTIFDITPDTDGWLYITATAHNHEPFEDSIQVVQPANKVHLYKNSLTLTDENGNGVVEPGEEINLNIHLRNSGGEDATGISAVLSSPAQNLTIPTASSSSDYPDIVSNASVPSDDFYSFTAPSSDTIRAIPLLLTIASDQGEFKEPFLLNTKSADLQLGDRYVTSDADNFDAEIHTFNIGDEVHIAVTVNNQGLATAESVSGELSTNLDASVASVNSISPVANYGDIDPQDHSDNIGDEFIVDIGNSYTGGALPFTLTLTDGFGATKSFAIDLADYPAAISGFVPTSFSDHTSMEWQAVENIKGYNVYHSLSEEGTYQQVNDLILTASTFDDLNLEPLTDYWYKISVVSQTGDERPLNELTPHHARTKIGYHEGFPVAANPAVVHGAQSSPTVYDIDGDGTKEIFVAYRDNLSSTGISGRLMGFKDTGEELFDIDNTDKVYGFAGTEKQLYAKPAVGDLEGDGQAEVIAAGRGFHQGPKWGSLYGFRTTDQDSDGKPDKLWGSGERKIHQKFYRNPVLADLNNDGYREILVLDEHQQIHVYDHKGHSLATFHIGSLDSGSYDYSEGQLAVADIDNDGYKEVVFGVKKDQDGKGAIYTWDPDGDFSRSPELLHEFAEGERADGGVVLVDIDNDNKYEVLTITRKGSIGYIYALNIEDGTPVSGWDGSKTVSISTNSLTVIPRIAVGDLNNNGYLEIVYGSVNPGSTNKLYAFGYDIGSGNWHSLDGFPVTDVKSMEKQSPILADIDGDDAIEIIVNSVKYKKINGVWIRDKSVLKAFNSDDGSACTGWKLSPDTGSFFVSSPYVGDIDNDGKNEVVISSGDNAVYVFDTQGDADKVEWGSYRHDAQNTGAYAIAPCVFNPDDGLDLMVRSVSDDRGEEPYPGSHNLWESPDIWVRNQDDGKLNHTSQNPAYNPSQPSFIYVRVQNKSCTPTTGGETLKLNWAKASSGLAWPTPWFGGTYFAGALMGDMVGEKNIPILKPGEEVILKFPWMVPNPADYVNLDLGSNPMHFCLLARVNAEEDPIMPLPSGSTSLNDYVRTNNNIAWKNVTVNLVVAGKAIGANFLMANFGQERKKYDLELVAEENNLTAPIFDQAEVRLHLSDRIYQKWKNGGSQSDYLRPTRLEHVLLVTHDHARLKNIQLNHGEVGTVGLSFNFLTDEVTDQMRFLYAAIQKENSAPHRIIGGETYLVKRRTRDLFYASAKVKKESVDSVTVKADTINEPAVYNWYDPQGNLIHSGHTLTVNSGRKADYKLEVIAQSDGYKDYAKVHVKNTHGLKSLTPNPASNSVLINYAVNSGSSSAYLMITNSVSGTFNNYLIDPEQSAVTIDLTGYQTGDYVVSLVVNGEIIDYKHLLVN